MDLSPRQTDRLARRRAAARRGRRNWTAIVRARRRARRRRRHRHQVPHARRSTTTATSTRSATRAAARPAGGCASRARSTRDPSAKNGDVTDFTITFNGVDHAGALRGRPGRICSRSASRSSCTARRSTARRVRGRPGRGQALQRVRGEEPRPPRRGHRRSRRHVRSTSLNGALGHAGADPRSWRPASFGALGARRSPRAPATGGCCARSPRYAWLALGRRGRSRSS